MALLRDARWDVAGAGPVPLLGVPGSAAAILSLVLLRLRRAARPAGIGAGLAFAEAIARSFRGLALVLCGAVAGDLTDRGVSSGALDSRRRVRAGYTGLTVTVGSVLTLFVLMQATARVDWSDLFARKAPVLPPIVSRD